MICIGNREGRKKKIRKNLFNYRRPMTMIKWRLILLLGVACGVGCSTQAQDSKVDAAKPGAVTIAMSVKMQGEIEPCG